MGSEMTLENLTFCRITRRPGTVAVLLAIVALVVTQPGLVAQISYRSGQPVYTAYEGWEVDEDGSRYFVFGYMNENWEEEPHVPVGPDNYVVAGQDGRELGTFDPETADRGQPTLFQPRRNRFVFRVPIPEGYGVDDEMIWSLTTNGETVTAHATLSLDYRVDGLIRASEQGAIGAGTSNPTIRANLPPVLRVEGPPQQTVRVGESLTLVAVATDDGVPEPRSRRVRRGRRTSTGAADSPSDNPLWRRPSQGTPGSARGLRFSWYVYRGTGKVSFDPLQAKVWEDSRAHTNSPWANFWETPPLPEDDTWRVEATFHEPGTYVLRALASDGALNVDSDVMVTVTP